MRGFLAALSFLSILPTGRFQAREADLRHALVWFPWVGLLFAILGCGAARIVVWALPLLPAALLLALLPEALTKCLHLDGLADAADGMLSSRPRERKLEIMRDSRTGTMGVAAITGLLGMKFALLASLPVALIPPVFGLSLLAGRCGMVWYIAMSTPARPDGLGAIWFRQPVRAGIGWGVLLLAAGAWTIIPAGAGAAWVAIAALIVMHPLAAAGWSFTTRRMLGGATGDTIGCFEELSELWTLLYFAVLLQHCSSPAGCVL